MNNPKFLFLILISLLLANCSKDDGPSGEVNEEFGTIKGVLTITEGLENVSVTIVTTTNPGSNITYLNTDDNYTQGPEETLQDVSVHNFETSDDASNLNLGVDFQTEQMTSNAHVEYTYEVFLNGNKKYSEKFEIDALAGQHMLGWNTKEGMVIDNVVTSN